MTLLVRYKSIQLLQNIQQAGLYETLIHGASEEMDQLPHVKFFTFT